MASLIEAVDVDGATVRVRAAAGIRRYLRDDFYAIYDSNVSLSSVDPYLLTLPFVLNVAPLVWLSGEDYLVEELDERLAEGLTQIRGFFARMHSDAEWGGAIVPRSIRGPSRVRPDGDATQAALFSGGVDSTYTALAESDGDPLLLVTVWGAEIADTQDAEWARRFEALSRFADSHGHEITIIRSNANSLVSRQAIARLTSARRLQSWWTYAQYGMGLIGLVAPLAAARGIGRILIASSQSEGEEPLYGSSPDIDERAAWETVAVRHHGYEVSRHQKLQYILQRGSRDGTAASLIVCNNKRFNRGLNCLRCEKCLRTAVAVMVEGQDPERYGLQSDRRAYRELRLRAALGSLRLIPGSAEFWSQLHERAATLEGTKDLASYPPRQRALVQFLGRLDVDRCLRRSRRAEQSRLRRLPPVKRARRRYRRWLSRRRTLGSPS